MRIRIAGQVIEVKSLYEKTRELLKNYIEEDGLEPDINIEIQFEDLIAEQIFTQQGSKVWTNSGETLFFNREQHEFFAIHRKIADALLAYGIILMHGSVVATNNSAYMFTAPSGVGKTTRTKLWVEEYPESYVVNGDKPFIKITETEILACGSPWCGKEKWNTNTMVPLKAILFLERIKDKETNSIEKISLSDAFSTLIQQTYFSGKSNAKYKTLQLLKEVGESVELYRFRSAPTTDAIRLAHKTVGLL